MNIIDALKNWKYNKELERMGLIDTTEIRSITIGWQPNESYQSDSGNEQENLKGKYNTPSGNQEYYKILRRSRK